MSNFIKVEGQGSIAAALRTFAKKLSGSLIDASGLPGWELKADGRWRPPLSYPASVSPKLSFRVTAADGGLKVSPGVVLGLSASYEVPTIGGVSLTSNPTLSNSQPWVFLRIEITPGVTGTGPYYMDDDEFTLNSVTIVNDSDDSEAQRAEVDIETGATTNLIALLPLAYIDSEGAPQYQLMYGPISCLFCSGNLSVKPPVIYHFGEVETVTP